MQPVPPEAIDGHVLSAARFVASPFCDARPPGCAITLVVLHGISLPPGRFGGDAVEGLFTGRLSDDVLRAYPDLRGLHVSTHLFVRRDGSVLQFVPFDRRAWHAGTSRWRGRANCNDFSIGIELEGADHVPYTAAQYARLRRVLTALRRHYPDIGADAVVGHEHVAPGRKTDPGPAFDWAALSIPA